MSQVAPAAEPPAAAGNGEAKDPQVNGSGGDVGPATEKAEDVEAGELAKPEYGPPADMTLLKVRDSRRWRVLACAPTSTAPPVRSLVSLSGTALLPLACLSPRTAVPDLPALRLPGCGWPGACQRGSVPTGQLSRTH